MCRFFSFFLQFLLLGGRTFHPILVVSPLNVAHFTLNLAGYPDQHAVAYVLQGLQQVFRLSFHPFGRLKVTKKNKPSAFQTPMVIDDYLAHEVSRCRVAGPFL